MIRVERFSEQPILSPNRDHTWEKAAVFSCRVILHNGLEHMIYGATDATSNGEEGKYVNNQGCAICSAASILTAVVSGCGPGPLTEKSPSMTAEVTPLWALPK